MSLKRSRSFHALSATADQYVYSLTNLLPAVVVAREANTKTFAQFAALLVVYSMVLGAFRASCGETAAVRGRLRGNRVEFLDTYRLLVARSCILGAIAGLLLMGVVSAVGVDDSLVWVAVIVIVTPFHVLHDLARVVLIAAGRAWRPLLSDVIWFFATLGSFFLAGLGPATFVVACAWGFGGVLACLTLVPPRRRKLNSSGARLWDSEFSRPSLIEFATQPAVVQGSQVMAGLVGTAAAVAALRGAAILFRPLQLVMTSHRLLSLGASAHLNSLSRGFKGRQLAAGLVGAAVATLGFGSLLMLTPDWAGEEVLGETWGLVQSLLLPLTLAQCLNQVTYVLITFKKSSGQMQNLGKLRALGVVTIPLGTVTGAALFGAGGAAWGFLAGQIPATVWTFALAMGQRQSETTR